MKQLKLNVNKKEQVETLLNEVQKRAKARLVRYQDIVEAIEKAEGYAEKRKLTKKEINGMEIELFEYVDCNSYNKRHFYADSTFLRLKRGAKDWYILDCCRQSAGTGRNSTNFLQVFYTAKQIEIIKDKHVRHINTCSDWQDEKK